MQIQLRQTTFYGRRLRCVKQIAISLASGLLQAFNLPGYLVGIFISNYAYLGGNSHFKTGGKKLKKIKF